MTSKLEQKETPQANGAVVPGDCLASPEPSDFLGSDSTGVEVVVLESRANAKGVREEDALLENGSQSNESDDTSTERGPEPASPLKETSFSIGLQVLFPFLLAGFGTVAAGMVLDIVQHWDVFKYVTEVFILVPALLGLKGNLEMTLASRLSTAAGPSELWVKPMEFSACWQGLNPSGMGIAEGRPCRRPPAAGPGRAGFPQPKELLGKCSVRRRSGEQILLGSFPSSQPCPCCRRRHSRAAGGWICSARASPLPPCGVWCCGCCSAQALGGQSCWAQLGQPAGTEAELCLAPRSGKQIPLFWLPPHCWDQDRTLAVPATGAFSLLALATSKGTKAVLALLCPLLGLAGAVFWQRNEPVAK